MGINFVKVPQLGANDSIGTVVDLSFQSDDLVKNSQVIITLETTKTTFDIESNFDGYIHYLVKIGQEVSIDDDLAIVSATEKDITNYLKEIIPTKSNQIDNLPRATKKAILLAEKHSVDLSKLKLDRIVKEKDIEKIINKNKHQHNNDSEHLIGNKKLAKDLMLFSNTNIPPSYIEIEYDVSLILNYINFIYTEKKQAMSILSIIIYALGKVLPQYRIFNAYRDNNEIIYYNDYNIGIALDINGNLTMPNIKAVNKLDLFEISKQIFAIRKDIMSNKSDLNNFENATFSVTSLEHTNIVRFTPIIHPKQCGIISIPKIIQKVVLKDKNVVEKNFINLGMSFDHSITNAAQCQKFLEELCDSVNKIVAIDDEK